MITLTEDELRLVDRVMGRLIMLQEDSRRQLRADVQSLVAAVIQQERERIAKRFDDGDLCPPSRHGGHSEGCQCDDIAEIIRSDE